MRRSRVTEGPRGPPSLRTSSYDSHPLHSRVKTERSPKLGTRIADLESQLGLAQEELRSLKNQLVSTEVARKAGQDQLEKKPKKQDKVHDPVEVEEKQHFTTIQTTQMSNKNDHGISYEASDDTSQATDVFEVPMEEEAASVGRKKEPELPGDDYEFKPKSVIVSNESPATSRPDDDMLFDEMCLLKKQLEEKDKELEVFRHENESLKSQLDEKSVKVSSAQCEINELTLRLNKAGEELEKSRNNESQIIEKMVAAEKATEELAHDMKRLAVQTEQWRKAADAAASVLAGVSSEMNGQGISERCGSMDKRHYEYDGTSVERLGGFAGYVVSHDIFGSDKRKSGSGMRMFGELWKKKGHK